MVSIFALKGKNPNRHAPCTLRDSVLDKSLKGPMSVQEFWRILLVWYLPLKLSSCLTETFHADGDMNT